MGGEGAHDNRQYVMRLRESVLESRRGICSIRTTTREALLVWNIA